MSVSSQSTLCCLIYDNGSELFKYFFFAFSQVEGSEEDVAGEGGFPSCFPESKTRLLHSLLVFPWACSLQLSPVCAHLVLSAALMAVIDWGAWAQPRLLLLLSPHVYIWEPGGPDHLESWPRMFVLSSGPEHFLSRPCIVMLSSWRVRSLQLLGPVVAGLPVWTWLPLHPVLSA